MLTIARIQIQGGSPVNYFFVAVEGGWGAASCPNATYAFFRSSQSGYREMLAAAMLAKASSKKVRFQGTCLSSDAFEADYVYVFEF